MVASNHTRPLLVTAPLLVLPLLTCHRASELRQDFLLPADHHQTMYQQSLVLSFVLVHCVAAVPGAAAALGPGA